MEGNPGDKIQPVTSGIFTPYRQKIIEEAFAIEAKHTIEAGELGFMGWVFVQTSLPHKDPKNVEVWGRRNGALSMVVQPGVYLDEKGRGVNIGIPYGGLPRLLLAWVTTEAVRTRERQLFLGKSLSQFMREIGLDPTGGQKGSITRLKNQMRKLFSANISCTYEGREKKGGLLEWANAGFRLADSIVLWWDPASPKQENLWNSTITLSELFFEGIIKNPVPIDIRVLKVLSQSAFSLDIYFWLTYRMSVLSKPTLVPWEALRAQFGAEYKRDRAFKENFLKSLQKVQLVYPGANVRSQDKGLLLMQGKPHVSRRLPGKGKKHNA